MATDKKQRRLGWSTKARGGSGDSTSRGSMHGTGGESAADTPRFRRLVGAVDHNGASHGRKRRH